MPTPATPPVPLAARAPRRNGSAPAVPRIAQLRTPSSGKSAGAVQGATDVPLLRDGMKLSQSEFHRLYESTPPGFRAELIGGFVYVASPQKRLTGQRQFGLADVASDYEDATPGVEMDMGATTILDDAAEPEPDVSLSIRPESGGKVRVNDAGYLVGAPELVIEVSDSTLARDLGPKREDYRRAGVREYLVLAVPAGRLYGFDLASGGELAPDDDGVYRSRAFPGLWIDERAALAADRVALLAALEAGLATREHAAFVKALAKARRAAAGTVAAKPGPDRKPAARNRGRKSS